MRGKVHAEYSGEEVVRITPACAGKSKKMRIQIDGTGDHPRVCGEKSSPLGTKFCVKGSPPRVRGKEEFLMSFVIALRITPACAGKSWRRFQCRPPPEDHPRVCGEKEMKRMKEEGRTGSPPRVRGKDFLVHTFRLLSGITPACAGKSLPLSRFQTAFWDHPRVCGEKVLQAGFQQIH